MKEYKVISQQGKFLSGQIEGCKLEETLNSYAIEGFKVIKSLSYSPTGYGDEVLIIMERDVPNKE